VDSCSGATGATDTCSLAGGNIYDSQSYCSETYEDVARDDSALSYGFRCCSK
jgi:hypothetical protein